MKIEAFILCFNEAKMIEHTLNHYASFCDKITIIDNQSTDDSIKIAHTKFPDKIEIVELDTDGEYREDVQIYVRNNCWKDSTADYVIMCDMDEFLYAENLTEQLELSYKNDVAIPVISGYNMINDTFPEDRSKPLASQVKTGFRDRSFDKSIIFSPKHVLEMNYGPGSHYCNAKLKTPKIDALIEFKLLHYKFLGKDHIYKKHKLYSDRMSEVNKKHKYGFEYDLGNNHVDKMFETYGSYLYKVIE